jgi:small nuclear ribonucleoprotein (snRNP)-like protein
MLIELKNGDTYNGRLVSCNIYMNVCLKDVICTSKVNNCKECILMTKKSEGNDVLFPSDFTDKCSFRLPSHRTEINSGRYQNVTYVATA